MASVQVRIFNTAVFTEHITQDNKAQSAGYRSGDVTPVLKFDII
jgi:hypothetical protein